MIEGKVCPKCRREEMTLLHTNKTPDGLEIDLKCGLCGYREKRVWKVVNIPDWVFAKKQTISNKPGTGRGQSPKQTAPIKLL